MTGGEPLLIASQLGEVRDTIIREMAPHLPIRIESIPRAPFAALPAGTRILFACGFDPQTPRAAGWPLDLDWIQLISTGLDIYPAWLFEAPLVSHGGGAMAVPIAEYCLGAIFAAAKQMPDVWIDGPDRWRLRGLAPIEGAHLGLFGFGAIGRAVADRALALGMRVHVLRGSSAPLPAGIERVADMAELMAVSDHLVLAAPATAETRHIVSRAALAQAKPGLHLINVARGSLVDQEALLDALDEGRVALASLDVAEPEPLPAGHAFYTHPRVRMSPHTSAMTIDGDARLAGFFVANLRRYLADGKVINRV